MKNTSISIIHVLGFLLSALYLAATAFAGYLLVGDYIECRAKYKSIVADGDRATLKSYEKCLREARDGMLCTPLVGIFFTISGIILFFETLFLKLKSFPEPIFRK